MEHLYYILTEAIKSYHVFSVFDKAKAAELLAFINQCRLDLVMIADQRQIFIDQMPVEANASGYKNDIMFSRDDIASLVIKMVAFLEQAVTASLTKQGTRENIFTRLSVQWQMIMSDVQAGVANGQQIPFDFPQEIFLDKNETLDIGITNQTADGFVFVHGCNLKDDYTPNRDLFLKEITALDELGRACLPEMQLVPVQFKFESATLGTKATAIDGGDQIYSIKSEKSVLLTHISTTSINSRISLIDRGRNQTICTETESLGVAGFFTNQFTVYYPLPYPHLLRKKDRFELKGINGSLITGEQETANANHVICFKGFSI